MDNHPIPQDVTGFQFKLIGNMTVKQFAYLATGAVLAWIFLQLPISIFIKFPISFVFAILGVGLAFVPVSGRPMDLMIGNFIKALIRPTQFIYEKTGSDKLKAYLQTKNPTPVSNLPAPSPTAASAPTPAPIVQPVSRNNTYFQPKITTKIYPISVKGRFIGMPIPPDSPNIVTGIVKDPRGNPLGNILIEVKDKENNPVRAFKTNDVGRFASATALMNGDYTIELEDPKGQNKFEVKTINITGQIFSPIEIISVDTREELRRTLFK